ncbi:MAG: NUDIX hydrolase [Candidatus Kapabacteria bacterium]|nr:NUDIX hydrolase [Candidatus Kapabacteria bacterium]
MELFFENISVRVRAIIRNDQGQIACLKQRLKDGYCWVVPGGGVERGETLQEALAREVAEETGMTIQGGKLVAIREIFISNYHRTYEYYFQVNWLLGNLQSGTDHRLESQEILDAQWLDSLTIFNYDVKPGFLVSLICDNPPLVVCSEMLTLSEYVGTYGCLPQANRVSELVHVVLKPDALEYGLEDVLVKEFENFGAVLIAKKRKRLNLSDFSIIYHDFSHESSRQMVSTYLTENDTVHLALVGKPGMHKILNANKGKTSGGVGLRGKYIKWHTQLSESDWQDWLAGKHSNQDKISLEMFCRNLIHISPDVHTSLRGLEAVFFTEIRF